MFLNVFFCFFCLKLTGDFKSSKALADYLKLLDNNDGLYLKYFDLKKDYELLNWPVAGKTEVENKLTAGCFIQ